MSKIPEDALICLGDDTSERGLGIVEEVEMLIGCSEILLDDISCVYGKALDGGIGHIFLREYIQKSDFFESAGQRGSFVYTLSIFLSSMFRRLSLLLLLLSFGLFAPATLAEVQVANDIDISVSPFRFDLSMTPGSTLTREITVFNNTPTTRTLTLKKENFLSNNLTGQPQFYEDGETGGAGAYRLSQWITLGQSSVTIPAKGRTNVSYTITAPASATPGGYYGAITFLNQDTTASGSVVRFDKKIASIILLTVS